jgi:hypothetical protein
MQARPLVGLDISRPPLSHVGGSKQSRRDTGLFVCVPPPWEMGNICSYLITVAHKRGRTPAPSTRASSRQLYCSALHSHTLGPRQRSGGFERARSLPPAPNCMPAHVACCASTQRGVVTRHGEHRPALRVHRAAVQRVAKPGGSAQRRTPLRNRASGDVRTSGCWLLSGIDSIGESFCDE